MNVLYATIRDIIDGQGSRIFSVEFVKKNGMYRSMQVQAATLPKRVKGDKASEKAQRAVATRKANYPNLYNIWSMDANAPRSFDMDAVLRITGSGQVLYEVENASQLIYDAKHVS